MPASLCHAVMSLITRRGEGSLSVYIRSDHFTLFNLQDGLGQLRKDLCHDYFRTKQRSTRKMVTSLI